MSGALLATFRYAPVFESSKIQTWRRPPNLHQPGRKLRFLLGPASWMAEDSFNLIRILNDGNSFHLSTTLRANQWINFIHLCKEAGPCLLVSKNPDFDFILWKRNTFITVGDDGIRVGSFPPFGSPF